MMHDTFTLPDRPVLHKPPAESQRPPDVAFAALPLFERLRDALMLVTPPPEPRRWGVPDLFFFDADLQSEWTANGERAAADWGALPNLLDDAIIVLAASATVRHAARAVPGLSAAARAASYPRAQQLAELLAVPDDEVIQVIHPAARAGFRVLVRGIADMRQFHVLLADAITGDPRRGWLPGTRPDPRLVAAYRDAPPDGEEIIARARFQFLRPEALRPDGTLPLGFAGSDYWLWGPESLALVPRVQGERTVLIGEPAFRATWNAARKLPWLGGELELVEVLTPAAVSRWLETQIGQPLLTTRDHKQYAA